MKKREQSLVLYNFPIFFMESLFSSPQKNNTPVSLRIITLVGVKSVAICQYAHGFLINQNELDNSMELLTKNASNSSKLIETH